MKVMLNTRVKDFDGSLVTMNDGSTLRTNNLIWAAGVKANPLPGLPTEAVGRGNRITVNRYNQVQGFTDIFAIGDVALMSEEPDYPNGHPQIAQPAIQQGGLVAKNLLRWVQGKEPKPFTYRNLGTMATIGRGLAVVDLPFIKFQGFLAWLTWLFVHLMSIVGVKNRLLIFINWMANYLTYNNSLRLIIRPKIPKGDIADMQRKVADQIEVGKPA